MGPGLLIHAILLFTFATIFYKGAELENKSPWLWTSLSVTTYAITFYLQIGWMGCIGVQVVLWIAIALLRGLVAMVHK